MPLVSRQAPRRHAQKRAQLAVAEAARPRCTECSLLGEDDKPLIIACCCEKLVHPCCFKAKQWFSIRQAQREGQVFPLSNVWDCSECGSGYRFRSANIFVRSLIDRPWVFPTAFIVMCFGVFVIVCEMTCLGMCEDRWGRGYLIRGCTILALIAAVTLQRKQVLLMFHCIIWLCKPASDDSMSCLTICYFVCIVGYNVYELTKRIYMCSLLLFVKSTTPSAYLQRGMDSAPASGEGSGDAGDRISADTPEEPHQRPLVVEHTQCLPAMPEAPCVCSKAVESVTRHRNVSSASSCDRCECICCLELAACCVASGCGHLVACANCRRRLVYKELRDRAVFGLPRMRDLRGEMLSETTVRCPMCRAEGTLVDRYAYEGVVFTP